MEEKPLTPESLATLFQHKQNEDIEVLNLVVSINNQLRKAKRDGKNLNLLVQRNFNYPNGVRIYVTSHPGICSIGGNRTTLSQLKKAVELFKLNWKERLIERQKETEQEYEFTL